MKRSQKLTNFVFPQCRKSKSFCYPCNNYRPVVLQEF